MSGKDRKSSSNESAKTQTSCDLLHFSTQLSSPKEAVIKKLVVRDRLDVALQTEGANVTVVALYQGKVAGGILYAESPRLRQCIEEGTVYVADVTSISEGQVRVHVHAV